jgi:VanZ family protein
LSVSKCMRSGLRTFFRWAPVMMWMVVIFSASSDTQSWQHSSRIVGPLVHWLMPHLTEHQFESVVLFVRKCAHMTEYAILALLIYSALTVFPRLEARKKVWWCVVLVILYAASDEFHQSFVPTREASVIDVLVDTSGAAGALFVLRLVGCWTKRKKSRHPQVKCSDHTARGSRDADF